MLQVKHVSFRYNKEKILDDINFSVKAGQHLSIIGESGSGKSTLLKLLYGEFDTEQGQIFWNDFEILGPKFNLVTGPSFMKYVAQEFDLMPFITVEESIGKFLSNFYPEEKQRRTDELLNIVELLPFAKTKVQFLSGGQKQRVALARAIAKQPNIILLDEPFSHIDNFKKQSLRRNLFNYLKEKNIACIVATHDKNDVLPFADHVIVLHKGVVVAKSTPKSLYHNPKTALIASFFGEFNVFKCHEIFENTTDNSEIIIYANQLQVVKTSNIKATVKQSFFNGKNYIIEAVFNNRSIFFQHQTEIQKGKVVALGKIDF